MFIITWLCQYYEIVWSLSVPLRSFVFDLRQWHLSTADIFDASFRFLEPRSFLVSLVFRPFPEHLACFGYDCQTEWRWKQFIELRRAELRHYILRWGCPSRNAFIRKEKFWARISREVKTLKALKVTFKCVYGPFLEYGNDRTIFFFHWYVNIRSQNSKSLIITCVYSSAEQSILFSLC